MQSNLKQSSPETPYLVGGEVNIDHIDLINGSLAKARGVVCALCAAGDRGSFNGMDHDEIMGCLLVVVEEIEKAQTSTRGLKV